MTSMPRLRLAGKINSTLPSLALALLTFAWPARAGGEVQRAPELPSPACDTVNVPEGNRLSARVFASGVQIYRWNGSAWVFIAPDAALYADPCYSAPVGLHYAGPTWEASDGSKVRAVVVDRCTPYRGAIPWLRLDSTWTSDQGVFAGVTCIQRVNTVGGTAPAEAGAYPGDEARVPYTAEYYLYRRAGN